MMKPLIAAILMAVSLMAAAKGSPGSADNGLPGGVVPIASAQRVMHFDEARNWGTAQGDVLVCPLDRSPHICRQDKAIGKLGNWVPLNSVQVPGFEMVALQYVFAGTSGNRQLLVYFKQAAK